ncbi:hypothetical protein ACIQVA_37265 [Streptomyces microflavus]|uniref:hypothetical protein n=1 Tax=Streptomyces microflavus TaxID=1919 RepID=UPI0037F6174A
MPVPLPLPAGALCVLIGAPGSGKSTFTAHYPATWRVCLDTYRGLATDSAGCQEASADAVLALRTLLKALSTVPGSGSSPCS